MTAPTVDVSPDGRTLVFDLLGNLYLLPIDGGQARPLTRAAISWNSEPHFSPNGKEVVFVSDRSGSSNVWAVDLATRHVRAITKGTGHAYLDPLVNPDGSHVLVAAAATNTEGDYDLWVLPFGLRRGGGSGGRRLLVGTGTKRMPAPDCESQLKSEVGTCPPVSRLEPMLAGRLGWVFFIAGSLRSYGTEWQVSATTLQGQPLTFSIPLPRDSGSVLRLRPIVSPNGRYLVYKTWRDTIIAWRCRDLFTNADTQLAPAELARPAITPAGPLTGADLATSAAFTPDGTAIVVGYMGGLWRIAIPSGAMSSIPFVARVIRPLASLARYSHEIPRRRVYVRQIIDARPAPNGQLLAFSALNHLYGMQRPHGVPFRLTMDSISEFEPAWSPDGREVAYVTWDDSAGGDVRLIAVDSGGKPVGKPRLLKAPRGMYTGLAFAADGMHVIAGFSAHRHALIEGFGDSVAVVGDQQSDKDSIRVITLSVDTQPPAMGPSVVGRSWRPATELATGLTGPLIETDNGSAFYFVHGWGSVLSRWRVSHGASETLLNVPDATELAPSLDERFVLASGQSGVFLVGPLANTDTTRRIELLGNSPPGTVVRQLDSTEGDWIGWFPNRRRIYYSRGSTFYTVDLLTGRRTADVIHLSVSRDIPHGTIDLENARLITMSDNKVIEHGDIIVRDDRIIAIGPHGAIRAPVGAVRLDLTGKTILPGWVDVHHHIYSRWSRFRAQPWQCLSDLSFGVTTVRDPLDPIQMLSYADRADAGNIECPRLFTTGLAVGLESSINGSRPAFLTSHRATQILRYFAANGTETIKQELMGIPDELADMSRSEQQAYVDAARTLHLTPTVHETEFREDMTLMLDGYAGHEHPYPVGAVFDDVVQLSARSGLTYTQTLAATCGWSQFARMTPFDSDERIARFMPHGTVALIQRVEQRNSRLGGCSVIAKQGASIAAGGGRVAMGSHGNYAGVGVQWELNAMTSGGMPPLDVIRAATINGAWSIGHERDIGSLEVGKLADLQVLDRNPLVDIRNAWTTRYVMKNGRLYDAKTLDQFYPTAEQLGTSWWRDAKDAGQSSDTTHTAGR